jgi:hypothetical protein
VLIGTRQQPLQLPPAKVDIFDQACHRRARFLDTLAEVLAQRQFASLDALPGGRQLLLASLLAGQLGRQRLVRNGPQLDDGWLVATQSCSPVTVADGQSHIPRGQMLLAAAQELVDQPAGQSLSAAMLADVRPDSLLEGFVQPPVRQGDLGLSNAQE